MNLGVRYGDCDLLIRDGFSETTSHNLEWFKSFGNYKAFIYFKSCYWHIQIAKYGVDGVGNTKMTIHKSFFRFRKFT